MIWERGNSFVLQTGEKYMAYEGCHFSKKYYVKPKLDSFGTEMNTFMDFSSHDAE